MTCKQFFKSTAFKCILVLVIIVLVSTVFLTICNSLFYVSDAERFQRTINKIYGKEVATEEIKLDDLNTTYTYSEIQEAYKVEDGNYLVKASGKQGFGGDVVAWVVVKVEENKIKGVGNVVVGSAPGESYISKVTPAALDNFSKIEYTDGFEYELGYKNNAKKDGDNKISTGASCSMRAISNAVNGAISFVNQYACGGEVDIPYYTQHGFSDLEYINQDVTLTYYTVSSATVTYHITTTGNAPAGAFTIDLKVGADGKISNYVITSDGSTKPAWTDKMSAEAKNLNGKTLNDIRTLISGINDGALSTGASKSSGLCYQAAAFALANYQKCLANPMQGGNS